MAEKLIGSCIVGQSGGPTSVINSSVYGAIRTALDTPEITNVYGAEHGILGVLNDRLYDMSKEDPDELALMLQTPSSILGSCRYKLKDFEQDDTDYKKILEVFKKHNVRYFFYNGGNDSMDTCNKISKFMQKSGWECRVMGIPKTIDNDLYGTDHSPGFASAAKYIAVSTEEVYLDSCAYDTGSIIVIEAMGRNAGWLAASASLAGVNGHGPDLIYLPECDFNIDEFFEDVLDIYNRQNNCIVVVSEGIHYADGRFVSEVVSSGSDGFGHAQLGGLAEMLADKLKEKTSAKVRGIELSLLQRCGAHMMSLVDQQEAFGAGAEVVNQAVSGVSGYMVAFEREMIDGKYHCKNFLIPLDKVANFEKKIPMDWINERHNNINEKYIEYALPLIQGEIDLKCKDGLPLHAKLKKVYAE